MMVARPKLVDVACDGPDDQGFVWSGKGDAVCRLPDAIGVYGATSVLTVETAHTGVCRWWSNICHLCNLCLSGSMAVTACCCM